MYFQLASITTFDPQNEMTQSKWSEQFKRNIKWSPSENPKLIIVIDESCGCSKRAVSHMNQLQTHAVRNTYDVQIINQSLTATNLLPNTPGAVLLDASGELVYAGPLSQGLACSASSGFVELAIDNLVAGFNSNLVVTDSKGCYCKGS
ncbi:DUF6436 domain-containing protein [Pseudoalteromonas sp. APC 3893]|uniref:DUF6436 domain-containing protein n=2 Tax=unclassified Pseudoalteromonas TaxID=194690 RepID=UPI0025B4E9F6|nr:DUF6436 domain-containing protein [Pseudoalteromonas sp. APC 3893]MDN3388128.1 DUF6436 domain-containing protein [Pseudoalteromonas sp. APC 4017]